MIKTILCGIALSSFLKVYEPKVGEWLFGNQKLQDIKKGRMVGKGACGLHRSRWEAPRY